MTKNEIRVTASSYGMEGHYRGNSTEDEPKGWFFTPLLKNMLKERLDKLHIKLQVAINQEATKLIHKLRAELNQCKIWLEEATEKEIKFNQLNITA